MNDLKIKRIAAINDFSGWSRCSLTVAIPILTAMGFHCAPVPTAILSNHTGYDDYFFDDYTEKIDMYLEQWKKVDPPLEFSSIYTGFLGSHSQIDCVLRFAEYFKKESTILLVDPVMGDEGKTYPTYTKEMCEDMKRLVSVSDYATPNVTEACILSDINYTSEEISDDDAQQIALKIADLGCKNVVITGLRRKDRIINYCYESGNKRFFSVSEKESYGAYCGTGDVFASLLTGAVTRGMTFEDAVKFASKITCIGVKESSEMGIDKLEGIAADRLIKEIVGEE